MKVLRRGSGAKSWSRKATCSGKGNGGGGCRARLLVEKGDLFQTYRSCMGREEDWYVTFQCPECKVLTNIDDYNVPFIAQDLPTYKSWRDRQRAPKAEVPSR